MILMWFSCDCPWISESVFLLAVSLDGGLTVPQVNNPSLFIKYFFVNIVHKRFFWWTFIFYEFSGSGRAADLYEQEANVISTYLALGLELCWLHYVMFYVFYIQA